LKQGIGKDTTRRGFVEVRDIQYRRKHIDGEVFVAIQSW
jgi:hypothetical protein